jgi:hypothetical protein
MVEPMQMTTPSVSAGIGVSKQFNTGPCGWGTEFLQLKQATTRVYPKAWELGEALALSAHQNQTAPAGLLVV